MNRRNFIENTGALVLSALLPLPTYSMFGKNKYKMGLQLYSIHQEMTKDTIATLKAAKAMGMKILKHLGLIMKKELIMVIKL